MQEIKRLLTLALCMAAGLLYSFGCIAQAKFTLTLDNANILELISWAQSVTDKTIIVHPAVSGNVRVVAGDPMTKGEAYQVFLSVLDVHGFSVTETAKAITVLPSEQATQHAAPVVSKLSQQTPEKVVVKIIEVKNVAASQLVNTIKPLIPKDGHVAAYPATNSIIATGRTSNIHELEQLISHIDKTEVVNIDLLPINFANAEEIVNIINSLLPQTGTAETKALQLAVDSRSNSILLTGDPSAKQQIYELVKRLDRPLAGDGNTQVIFLDYVKATEMVPILQGVSGSQQKTDQSAAAGEVEVSILANEALNALVITAPPSLLTTLKGVIHKLDIRRAQVLVEALIVEVNQDLSSSFGVEWQVPASNPEQIIGGFSSFPSGTSALSLNEAGNMVLGSGLSLGYLRGATSLAAVISALKGSSNANILSTPTIMALDNEEARILVGENVPFVTGSQNRAGDDDPFQTIERQDIGVSLVVKPRVNNNQSVTLEIEQSVESIGITDVETADIITNKREIKTRVLIGNGEVLVLGGLIRDEAVESESRVPLLGHIPILGRAFRSTSTSSVKRNLMVFIHPQILPDQMSGIAETSRRYDYMREKQDEFHSRIDKLFLREPTPKLPADPHGQQSTSRSAPLPGE